MFMPETKDILSPLGSHTFMNMPILYGSGSGMYFENQSFIDPSIVASVYNQGRKDGANDMQLELIRRGKALFQMDLKKV